MRLTERNPILRASHTYDLAYVPLKFYIHYDYIKYAWVERHRGTHTIAHKHGWLKNGHSSTITNNITHLLLIYIYIYHIWLHVPTLIRVCKKSFHVLSWVACYLSILIPIFISPYFHTHEDKVVLGYPTQY